MPTGYTAKLVENGQSFKEFAMGCARAFGACIEMRDDPQDAPIPEEFKPSDYHAKALAEAQKTAERYAAMSAGELLAMGQKFKRESIAGWRNCIDAHNAENARLVTMRSQVEMWRPPSGDHAEFKKFMLQQLEVSMHDTKWSMEALEKSEAKTPQQYADEAIIEAGRSIGYHAKELEEDTQRAADRTRWVKQLRESLK